MALPKALDRFLKGHPGLYCVAGYFVAEGASYVNHFYRAFESSTAEVTSLFWLALLTLGSFAAVAGLTKRQGWGWNLAIFLNCYPLGLGLRRIAYYFLIEPRKAAVVIGAADILIAGLVFWYLLRAETRRMFPESPTSLSLLGATLVIFHVTQRTGNVALDYLQMILALVGFAMIAKAVQQFRKTSGALS